MPFDKIQKTCVYIKVYLRASWRVATRPNHRHCRIASSPSVVIVLAVVVVVVVTVARVTVVFVVVVPFKFVAVVNP